MHYVSEQPDFETLIIFFPTSSGVSEWACERMSEADYTSEASNAEPTNEWAVQVNERMDEQGAQY